MKISRITVVYKSVLYVRYLDSIFRASDQKLGVMAPVILTGLKKIVDQPPEVTRKFLQSYPFIAVDVVVVVVVVVLCCCCCFVLLLLLLLLLFRTQSYMSFPMSPLAVWPSK